MMKDNIDLGAEICSRINGDRESRLRTIREFDELLGCVVGNPRFEEAKAFAARCFDLRAVPSIYVACSIRNKIILEYLEIFK